MMSFAQAWRRLRQKMVRDPLPPEDVAGGWALGMFIGCSVPFGLQLIISIPLALMMRVSKIGATLGTFITNPLTIFFIYPFQTLLIDNLLFGGKLSYSRLCEMEWSWRSVRILGAEAVASFFLGGILIGAILSPLTYFIVRRVVISHRSRHKRKDI